MPFAQQPFSPAFSQGDLLDIGCGSGCDLQALIDAGYAAAEVKAALPAIALAVKMLRG